MSFCTDLQFTLAMPDLTLAGHLSCLWHPWLTEDRLFARVVLGMDEAERLGLGSPVKESEVYQDSFIPVI